MEKRQAIAAEALHNRLRVERTIAGIPARVVDHAHRRLASSDADVGLREYVDHMVASLRNRQVSSDMNKRERRAAIRALESLI